jgi:hypothetical protein
LADHFAGLDKIEVALKARTGGPFLLPNSLPTSLEGATMVKLCSEILPTGSRCAQFALRGRAWCRAHATAIQRESNADARQLIEMIRGMDTFTVSATLCTILDCLRKKLIPPLQAQAIFDAATIRLEQLAEQQLNAHRRITPIDTMSPNNPLSNESVTGPYSHPGHNSHGHNRLQQS